MKNVNYAYLLDSIYQYKFYRIYDLENNKEMQTFPYTYNLKQIKDYCLSYFKNRYYKKDSVDLSKFELQYCYSPGLGTYEKHFVLGTLLDLVNDNTI